MSHSIGSTIWVFDRNHRVYRKTAVGHSTGPVFREHFRPHIITGETSRSWVLAHGLKVPKVGGDVREAGGGPYGKVRVYMTKKAVDDAVWLDDNAWRLRDHMQMIHDADLLRRVAELVGYTETKDE